MVRGLRHIKTACGNRRSIPPDDSPHSMRSHIAQRERMGSGGGRGMGGGMAKAQGPNKSPYKVRVTPPPSLSSLRVQGLSEPPVELTQDGGSVDVCILLPPPAADAAQLDVRGDILVVQAEAGDSRYYAECLLPFVAKLTEHTYRDGALHVILTQKED